MNSAASPWRETAKGLVLHVRLTPKGGRDTIDGMRPGADGRPELHVRVRAAPDKGAANAALVRLLAKAADLPASSLEIASGATSRHKTVAIAGDPSALAARLQGLLQTIRK